MDLLYAENEIEAPANPNTFNGKPTGALKLEALSFSYSPRRESKALDGISLDIRPGESVALIGPSGAGKSTLFDLILCFYFIAQLLQQYDSYLGESGVRLTGG